MRDVGFFVWVVLLIVGVIGSMASSARKQAAARSQPPSGPGASIPPQWTPPDASGRQRQVVQVLQMVAAGQSPTQPVNAPPRPVPAPTPPPPRPVPPPAHPLEAVHVPRRHGFFGTGPEIVRAVIAAEVLGKPHALRDE